MKMQEVRKIARTWGVNAGVGRKKSDIIHDIQVREGYSPCFRTREVCDEYGCLWEEDCMNHTSGRASRTTERRNVP